MTESFKYVCKLRTLRLIKKLSRDQHKQVCQFWLKLNKNLKNLIKLKVYGV